MERENIDMERENIDMERKNIDMEREKIRIKDELKKKCKWKEKDEVRKDNEDVIIY